MCGWDKTTTNIYNKLNEYKLIDHYKHLIKKTNESQGHGKSMEKSIQTNIFKMTEEEMKTYKNTDPHDIRKEHNRLVNIPFKGNNISIKTTTRNEIDCADILRFLETSETWMICIIMEQKNDVIKEAKKTICFSIDEFLEKMWEDIKIEKKIEKSKYLEHITEFIHLVKNVPKKTKTKELKINKKIYETTMFKISAKPSQNRVQARIKISGLENLKSYKDFNGGELFNYKYDKEINSGRRVRNKSKSL
jgi:hypothetical protein